MIYLDVCISTFLQLKKRDKAQAGNCPFWFGPRLVSYWNKPFLLPSHSESHLTPVSNPEEKPEKKAKGIRTAPWPSAVCSFPEASKCVQMVQPTGLQSPSQPCPSHPLQTPSPPPSNPQGMLLSILLHKWNCDAQKHEITHPSSPAHEWPVGLRPGLSDTCARLSHCAYPPMPWLVQIQLNLNIAALKGKRSCEGQQGLEGSGLQRQAVPGGTYKYELQPAAYAGPTWTMATGQRRGHQPARL